MLLGGLCLFVMLVFAVLLLLDNDSQTLSVSDLPMTITLQEKIPYRTIYENNSEMYRHQRRVKQEGVYGVRLVTYQITMNNGKEIQRIILSENVINQPQERIVIRGTKNVVVSSRGGQFPGSFEWPIRGPVTSKFGYRTLKGEREFHSGLDLNGITGDPVGAAQKGTVAFAGWCGTLGNTIAIDHGQGVVTRYCHLSDFTVVEGKRVEQGKTIGKVGSTGRSTGSHLHFEIWVKGEPQNPLNYLGR